MNQSKKVKKLVLLSLFIGIEIVLISTPLGFIPIGPIKATTLHIPVIVGAILLGKKEGLILGFIFGMSSIIMSTFQPTPFSFCFSPFYSIGEIHGNFYSILIALIPRVLIGYSSYVSFKFLSKRINDNSSIICASLIGTLTNTIFVMSGIWLFFGKEYASVAGFAYETFFNVIKVTIFTNGILETILAGIISLSIVKALRKRGYIYE